MKLLISLLFMTFSFSTFANVGFNCPELNISIKRAAYDKNFGTLAILDQRLGTESLIKGIKFPLDNTIDAHQERWYQYLELMNEAQMHFPYMPEFILVFHTMRSTTDYKKGFRAFEGEGSPIKLKKMYCKALVKALNAKN
ncbi:MAG: hypothetical protein U0T83_09905 [Bacteriovoracaceae bacterium]